MTDTIYTPHEMLDRVEARCHVLRAEIDALCAERDICNSEISAAFSALASF